MKWSAPPRRGTLGLLARRITMRTRPTNAAVYGIDVGKTCFHVVAVDVAGNVVQKCKLSRATIFTFFVNAPQALIGMEACPGSQWLSRKSPWRTRLRALPG